MARMSEKMLKVLPLGGLGEIGMNCLALEWDDALVLVDCGIQFPGPNYPGAEMLTPDLRYLIERRKKLKGVVVTHGHDDHIGGIPFLAERMPVTVYTPPFPRGLLENKLEEHPGAREVTFVEYQAGKSFSVGPFTFHPIPVQHSIIESHAFAIETPVGVVVHTGDFKHDPNEIGGESFSFEGFERWGNAGIRLLMSDSTNAERIGHTISELDIAGSFEKIFDKQSGRILVALFASNIRRIETLLHLAHQRGKKVALLGRSMHSYTRLAHELGTIKIPPETLVLVEHVGQFKDDEVIVLLTGSQAEPQSALVRIAHHEHKDFEIRPGDTVYLSSRFIPGNERNISAMIDQLYRSGAEVVYESFHAIHVSGHGFQEELLMMLNACKPQYFVPLHGEYRHLSKHAKLAKQSGVRPENVFVIENGQSIELGVDSMRLGEKYELEKGVVVDRFSMESSATLFSKRVQLSKTGVVFAGIVRDKRTHDLICRPSVMPYGLLYREGEDEVSTVEGAKDWIEDIYEEILDAEDPVEALRIEMRRYFRKKVSHKPVVIPLITDI